MLTFVRQSKDAVVTVRRLLEGEGGGSSGVGCRLERSFSHLFPNNKSVKVFEVDLCCWRSVGVAGGRAGAVLETHSLTAATATVAAVTQSLLLARPVIDIGLM